MKITKLLTMVILVASAAGAFADPIYETGFEAPTFTNGVSVNGIENWVYPGTSKTSALATNAVKYAGDQSLVFGYTSEAGNQVLQFDMSSQLGAQSGIVSLETWVNIDSISKALLLQVHGTRESSTATTVAQVTFNTDNSISAISGYSDTTSDQTWVSGQWVHVAIQVDTDADKYNVQINDSLLWEEQMNLRSNYVISDVTKMGVFKESYATGTIYLDDVKMGAYSAIVPEPCTAGLLAIGILGFAAKKRRKA